MWSPEPWEGCPVCIWAPTHLLWDWIRAQWPMCWGLGFQGGTIGRCWNLCRVGSSERRSGHWRCVLKGTVGLLLFFSAVAGDEASGFAPPHTTAMMCCLATGPEQRGQWIMEPSKLSPSRPFLVISWLSQDLLHWQQTDQHPTFYKKWSVELALTLGQFLGSRCQACVVSCNLPTPRGCECC
jgi:hypothetical protein